MSDSVLIVGAGVFGSVIAARLREDGHSVRVFDCRKPEAGSIPSGGHLKPSWLTMIPNKELEASFQTLSRLYGVETLHCKFLMKNVDLFRVDVLSVLNGSLVEQVEVTQVADGWIRYSKNGKQFVARGIVIVAAGYWTGELVPQIRHLICGKRGMSSVYTISSKSANISNVIIPWAPYKQIVRTSHGAGKIWIGDGTAILTQNWNSDLEDKIKARVAPYAPTFCTDVLVQRGIRPYIKGEGLGQVSPGLWYVTGGGKSGMALAGVYANKLAEVLK